MSEFITELCVDLKPGSDKIWIPRSPLIYDSDLVGRIEVPTGFETDFASVPRVPIIYWLWGGRVHREAALHDYLFRKDSKPVVSFMVANAVFKEAMIVRGKPWYVVYPMYSGVVLGSYGCYHKRLVGDSI